MSLLGCNLYFDSSPFALITIKRTHMKRCPTWSSSWIATTYTTNILTSGEYIRSPDFEQFRTYHDCPLAIWKAHHYHSINSAWCEAFDPWIWYGYSSVERNMVLIYEKSVQQTLREFFESKILQGTRVREFKPIIYTEQLTNRIPLPFRMDCGLLN